MFFEEKLEIIKRELNLKERQILIDQKVEFSLMVQFDKDEVNFRFTGFIWGEYLAPIDISCPLTWWQLFKKRNFPTWLINMLPIQYREETIVPKVFYPELMDPEAALEKFKVAGIFPVSREGIMSTSIDALVRDMWVKRETSLRDFMFEKGESVISYFYPKTGWQAFKKKWFSAKLLDWSPIEYRRIILLSAADIDSAQISFPDQVHFVTLSR